ncbi:MAG: hypothetical protein KDB22_00655 [Planctomycetales bacterium]|nr:hypothetical protein [Planctomycetales bacterium]
MDKPETQPLRSQARLVDAGQPDKQIQNAQRLAKVGDSSDVRWLASDGQQRPRAVEKRKRDGWCVRSRDRSDGTALH